MTDFDRSMTVGKLDEPPIWELGPAVSDVVRDAVETVTSNALVTGTRSEQMADALAPAKAAIEADVARDLGGDIPTTLTRLVSAFSETTLLRESVFMRMAGEPTTNKGKARALLSAYLQLVDRELRLSQAIGLERRAKPVQSIGEIMREHIEKPTDGQ
jgi:hypothetical protein